MNINDEYYIPHYRYLELKYYCLQYPIWEDAYKHIKDIYENHPEQYNLFAKTDDENLAKESIKRSVEGFRKRMTMVMNATFETCGDETIAKLLLDSVAQGHSYDSLKKFNTNIPISKKAFYDLQKKFYYNLSRARN